MTVEVRLRPEAEPRQALENSYYLQMATEERIVIDPLIGHGKPVIRGTRVPVTVVVGSLAGGMTFEEIQREYDLTADDIRAVERAICVQLGLSPT